MEFLGAMFEGIGKTFEAGAQVNLGQMNERNIRLQTNLQRDALEYQAEGDALNYLLTSKSQETRLITIVLIACIVMVGLLIIFR